ncbi:E3 ubiquitin-protein ligase znrf2-like [Saccoglossus kowalevskii]|uniref:RING-type E3 ubiquitin transferase n=1 Tax=Saccoglossus kowalevskii TaxID=10224 RepID=A0ABM0H018_SACKO|nr:PREDICTED: E3 ubiquitin-protein ligase ZNRF2-like [Saccoglossus kowalevskii]
MGAKPSTSNPRLRTYSGAGPSGGSTSSTTAGGAGVFSFGQHHNIFGSNSSNPRGRARSLGSVQNGLGQQNMHGLTISGNGGFSPDSDSSSPDVEASQLFAVQAAQSLPAHLLSPTFLTGIKCPVCSKFVPPDDIECHLVICLTKPRISYNEDVLTTDTGECVICLDDLQQGDTIARLPCLCIYHKSCIDSWFEVNRSCPEHPND